MRWALLALALGACRPDIAYGAYTCGPEASCPSDQACDETMDVCVDPPSAAPFACTVPDPEPDNDAQTATPVGVLTCISSPHVLASCVEGGDALDMFSFTTPAGCTTVALSAEITFQIAYEDLKLTLAAADGTTVLATDVDCSSGGPPDDGLVGRCVTAPLVSSTTYTLRIEPTGDGDCGGACAFNRYHLSVQLTP